MAPMPLALAFLLAALVLVTACSSSGRPRRTGENVAQALPGMAAETGPREPKKTELDAAAVERFARLALDAIHREYPNKIGLVMESPADLGEPHELTPIFYGSFDWHSSVHGHWLLVRLCRMFPEADFVPAARRALRRSFTAEKAARELAYMDRKSRISFERPYGLAWLLQLSAELHAWEDEEAKSWASVIEPLAALATQRFLDWFPKLTHPIRTGEHSQTAFAMGLILDWARERGHREMERLVVQRGMDFYLSDQNWNLDFEPSGQDFLSPGLAEADFMRRVLEPGQFAGFLRRLLPGIPKVANNANWLPPAVVTDISDGKLAHLDGLNLSRAWMLDGIASSLPPSDPRIDALRRSQERHTQLGLASVTGEDYAGGHWLASFAVYLLTRRGL
jgi:Protein of unknown function (DUF2891)